MRVIGRRESCYYCNGGHCDKCGSPNAGVATIQDVMAANDHPKRTRMLEQMRKHEITTAIWCPDCEALYLILPCDYPVS